MTLRCVVVEDQVMFLQLLVAMLRTQPQLEVVATAQGVQEALAVCQRHQPDLVILDLALPDGDGQAVIEALRQADQPPRVIVLSGQASTFFCGAELRPLVHAVVDKTRAYADLTAAIQPLLAAQTEADPTPAPLTSRERQVFALIGRGLTNRAIAEQLGLSLRTVESHRKNITHKVGTKGGDLVRQAALALQMSLHRVD
jgi:DNA-binding NarL/FixJ family response regulator